MKRNSLVVRHIFFAVFIMFMAVFVLCPDRAEAADSAWYEMYEYDLDDEEGTIFLKHYLGSGDVFVPRSATIGGKTYRTSFGSGRMNHLFSYNVTITSVTFENGFIFPEDCTSLFDFCNGLKSVTFPADIDTSGVRSMDSMFAYCYGLESLDISMFDTSNVENFNGMFFDCEKLKQIDVSSFDTRKATDMGSMFSCCKKLESLDLGNFVTTNVTDMSSMFNDCFAIESVNISGFNTSNVTDMHGMFSNCRMLKHIDLSHFNTGKVTNMKEMFAVTGSLQELDVSGFDTSNVESFQMFLTYSNVEEVDLSGFNTTSAKDMSYMFSNSRGIKKLDISGFDMSSVTNASAMFLGCSGIKELITPATITDMEITLPNYKKYARKNADGVLYEPFYEDLKDAPENEHIYRYDTYTVKFNANGGEGTMGDQTVQCGAAIALNPNCFTREGYTFDGWAYGSTDSSLVYADEEKVTDLTRESWSVTLYARWRRTSGFTVSIPAIVYMYEKAGMEYPGGDLEGTLQYTIEYTGDSGDYVSIEGQTTGISSEGGETIPVKVLDLPGLWTTESTGAEKDSETGVYKGTGRILLRARRDASDIEPGTYRGTLVINISSGTE